MKKLLAVMSLLCLFLQHAHGQRFYSDDELTMNQKLQIIADTVKLFRDSSLLELESDTSKGRLFSKGAFTRYFDQYFTLLNYQRQTFTEGNSASLVTSENDTKLSLSFSKKSGSSIFSLGTNLNIKDKSGSLFSGDKPTAGTTITAGYSVLLPFYKGIKYWNNGIETTARKRVEFLDSLYRIHSLKNPKRYSTLIAQYRSIEWRLKSMDNEIFCLKKSIDSLHRLTPRPDSLIARFDSIRSVLYDLIPASLTERDKIKKELESIELSVPINDAIEQLITAVEEGYIKEQLKSKAVTIYRLSWMSTSASYKRDSYDTYDSLLVFGKRISSKDANIWTFSLTYNFFYGKTPDFFKKTKRIFNSTYIGVSYSLSSANNYSDIENTSITVETLHPGKDSTYIVSSDKKLKDITRKDFESYVKKRFGLQFTQTFGTTGFVGLNLIGSLESGKNTISNFRSGLLFQFKDSEKEKSLVNFEIFINLTDLDNVKESSKSVWQRKEIGISTVVPFQKVFFN